MEDSDIEKNSMNSVKEETIPEHSNDISEFNSNDNSANICVEPDINSFLNEEFNELESSSIGASSSKTEVKEARRIGPHCSSNNCEKTKSRQCSSISDAERENIFKYFWKSLTSWNERKLFISSLVEKVPVKRRYAESKKRNFSVTYKLPKEDGSKVTVCQHLFTSTLAISRRTLHYWIEKDGNSSVSKQSSTSYKAPKTGKTAPIGEDVLDYIKKWLHSIPAFPSYYCRKIPAYENKKFICSGISLNRLYGDYCDASKADGIRKTVSCSTFSNIFHQKNFSIFKPRKDQCDKCIAGNLNILSTEELDNHIMMKNKAQDEKHSDKENTSISVSVWTMDLQPVTLCPAINVSCSYYKQKLQIHNFTLYNLANEDGYCYIWNESEGDLSADMFAYLQYKHFKKFICENANIKLIIIWSDGCDYQSRNTTLSNMYLHLSMETNVTIVQKFLTVGHTQIECDSIHSVIERCISKNDIFSPQDFITFVKCSRITPRPYIVTEINFSEVTKLNHSYITSICPERNIDDPKVNNLVAMKYLPEGKIKYKIDFQSENFEDLPERVRIISNVTFIPLFQKRQSIKKQKYDHLQSMKSLIPADIHNFYDNLRYFSE